MANAYSIILGCQVTVTPAGGKGLQVSQTHTTNFRLLGFLGLFPCFVHCSFQYYADYQLVFPLFLSFSSVSIGFFGFIDRRFTKMGLFVILQRCIVWHLSYRRREEGITYGLMLFLTWWALCT